jgi:lipoprotein-releasing system permease protein
VTTAAETPARAAPLGAARPLPEPRRRRTLGLELRIALRYLASRRKSRFLSLITFIAVGGVFVGVAALIIVMGVMNGLQEDLRGKILANTPHVVFQRYDDRPMEDWRSLLARIREVPGVRAAAPFLYTEGIVGHGPNRNEGAVIRGVDPRAEADVTETSRRMISGAWDLEARPGERYPKLVLGYLMADRLRALPGDTASSSTRPCRRSRTTSGSPTSRTASPRTSPTSGRRRRSPAR